MPRVVHLKLFGEADARQVAGQLLTLSRTRDWDGDRPWLAHLASRHFFEMEYWRHVSLETSLNPSMPKGLLAAGFVRIKHDECDALALLFIARELSEQFGLTARIDDPENPIAKLRHVELSGGKLRDGTSLESVLVATRPIFKRMPGAVIEMYPPRALGSAFGTVDAHNNSRRIWSFSVHGMRGSGAGFLEAEAEAMRIYRGLRFLT